VNRSPTHLPTALLVATLLVGGTLALLVQARLPQALPPTPAAPAAAPPAPVVMPTPFVHWPKRWLERLTTDGGGWCVALIEERSTAYDWSTAVVGFACVAPCPTGGAE